MTDWSCVDCDADTGLEYYMVLDTLWEKHGQDPFLCVGCLEKRMGRELTGGDFTDCLLNESDMGWKKSDRLIERLSR